MKINKYIHTLAAAAALFLVAGCSPDDYSMGSAGISQADLQEGIAFSIAPDDANANLICLKNLKPQYNAFWSHPGVGTGHSKGNDVKLQIAFPGSYRFVYGIDTPAGMIYSDTVSLDISTFCADFVSGDEWTWLAGGAGGSKTWVPDNGKVGMKQGFYSCFAPQATYSTMTHDEGLNNWYAKDYTWWEPANTDVGITDADLLQEMTLSLSGGAYITVKYQDGTEKTGTFAFDPDNHGISAVGLEFPHGAWADGKSKSFSSDFYVFHLDNNQLMIANLRDKALSGEDPCWYVWNFVSKEYRDNYEVSVPQEPRIYDGWQDSVMVRKKTEITWGLNEDTPFDYFTVGGVRKNSYSKPGDYPAFIAPLEGLSRYQLILDSDGNTYKMKDTQAGIIASGKYTLTNKGVYTFDNGLGSVLIGGEWVKLEADADGQLRLLQFDYDETLSKATDIWLGAKQTNIDGSLYQYQGYHFTAAADAGEKPSYAATMTYQVSDWSKSETSDPVKVQDDGGVYTCTLTGAQDNIYCLYLDVAKLMVDHPNATLELLDIKVDGVTLTGVDFAWAGFAKNDDGTQQTVDGNNKDARLYICNPWNASGNEENPFYSYFAGGGTNCTPLNYTKNLSVTFKVNFND
jgi:hypothetical protein